MGHQKYTHTHTFTFTFTYTYTYLLLQYCCHGLSSHNLCQAQLGTKFGGLGLRSSKAYAAAAYLSSFLSSNFLAEQFLGKKIQTSHFLSFLSGFYFLVNANSQLSVDSPTAKQNLLSSAIDQQYLKSILTDLDALDKARLLSCGMPHANAWIWALSLLTQACFPA